MKHGLYLKLAFNNLGKNRRIFIPRILSEAGLVLCIYIVLTLAGDKRLSEVEGGSYIPSLMAIAAVVIAILAAVLMLYTNSFLMKQRKREFGVYNVLGMEKRHVGKVLFWESLMSSVSALVLGIVFGMLFYKAASLLICRLLQTEIVAGFYYINFGTIGYTLVFFVTIDVLTYIFNRISILLMKPVDLLVSSHTGEKEPRVRWLILLIGIGTMGYGYFLAITTQSPLKALNYFFLAVIMVMIGTYCLFITGITFVLKLLKRNKKYYYNKRHMPAVSGLLYRMKQNSVGLASICILATGVLVMISTTVSLYSGMQDTLDKNYPYELYVSAGYEVPADSESESEERVTEMKDIPAEVLIDYINSIADKHGIKTEEIITQKYLEVSYVYRDNSFLTKTEITGGWDIDELSTVAFITEDIYTDLTGEVLGLGENEMAICTVTSRPGTMDPTGKLTIAGKNYDIAVNLSTYPISSTSSNLAGYYGVVLANEDELQRIYRANVEAYGNYASQYSERIAVKFENSEEACKMGPQMQDELFSYMLLYAEQMAGKGTPLSSTVDSKWEARNEILGMYGTFLFLGILLGTVCIFGTVLIIYYKQVSEGYEDRTRFQIMQKVGMSTAEVKKTIKSQLLLQFFSPLVMAGIHICVAFPMLTRMLRILLLSDTMLFVICTIITYLVFAAVYTVIYSMTAKTYYKIVH